jgi:hypothetical protein
MAAQQAWSNRWTLRRIQYGILRFHAHEKARQAAVPIQVHQQGGPLALRVQFEREMARDGSCADTAFAPQHADHGARLLLWLHGALAGAALLPHDRKTQRTSHCRGIQLVLHQVILSAGFYRADRERLAIQAAPDQYGDA